MIVVVAVVALCLLGWLVCLFGWFAGLFVVVAVVDVAVVCVVGWFVGLFVAAVVSVGVRCC